MRPGMIAFNYLIDRGNEITERSLKLYMLPRLSFAGIYLRRAKTELTDASQHFGF